MGCAIFPEQKNAINEGQPIRGNKKTNKIDLRKRSSQTLEVVVQNISILDQKLKEQDIEFVSKILKQHPLFWTLQNTQLVKIASSMQIGTAIKDQYIFKQQDSGTCFFIIKEGSVNVQKDRKIVKTMGKGQCFGEIALIQSTKRTASIKCIQNNLQLFFIKSKQFKQIMKTIRQKYNQNTKKLVENVQIFSLLTTKQKFTMLNYLVRQHYKKGTVLFQKNDPSLCFYIIQSGNVKIQFQDPTKNDIVLGQLESFGESTFKKNGKREGTAIVQEDLVCMTISQQKMKQCLGGTLSSIVFHNIKKWALKSSPLFKNLDNKQIDHLAMQFVTKYTKAGNIIMDTQKPVNCLVVCMEGKINYKPVGTLLNDQYYYEKGNLKTDLIKNDNGAYAVLGFDKIKQILNSFNNQVNTPVSRKKQSVQLKQNQNSLNSLNLDNLDYLTKLGQGQFGMVHLVKDRKSGNLFALKCLQKQKIKDQSMQQSAISERQILASLCHPLIVGFYNAYQDRKNIYFLLQYICGIQMFDAIRDIGILNKVIARFYFGSLILAVQHLHSKNIIYRDLKPENSIVNLQGKVYLIDMGTAKVLKSSNSYKTDTIIGTPHYMAPEVMQGKGYSFQADFWSFGVLFYQLICGKLPFNEEQDDPYKIYEFVIRNQVKFPSFLADESAKTLIKKLLSKNLKSRLVGGFVQLKNSQYFQGFNWDDLYTGKMVPPYIPRNLRNRSNAKNNQMHGYPLRQFLYQKRKGDKILTQKFKIWTNNAII